MANYPATEDLMGLGMAPELAAILGGLAVAPALSDLALLGMPIEQAREIAGLSRNENLLKYSETTSNALWVASNATKGAEKVFTATAQDGQIYQLVACTSGQVYRFKADVKLASGSGQLFLTTTFGAGSYTTVGTDWVTLTYNATATSTTNAGFAVADHRASAWTAIEIRNVQVARIENLSAYVTTTDTARSANATPDQLVGLGMNPALAEAIGREL